MEQPALLEMRNITKEFPGVKALDGVSLTVRPGTVHALMGENGCRKVHPDEMSVRHLCQECRYHRSGR